MRRKWVILAALVFLGLVGWVVVRGNQKGYSVNEVSTVLTDHGATSHIITESRIEMPVFRKRSLHPLQKIINWFRYDVLSDRRKTPFPSFYCGSGYQGISIHLYGENNRVHEVKIYSDTVDPQYALDIQSKLTDAFPQLPCTIVAPSP